MFLTKQQHDNTNIITMFMLKLKYKCSYKTTQVPFIDVSMTMSFMYSLLISPGRGVADCASMCHLCGGKSAPLMVVGPEVW